MSSDAKSEEKKDSKDAAASDAAAAPKKPSKIGGLLGIILPAIFAAGAAYGATIKAAAAHPATATCGGGHEGGEHAEAKHDEPPPGPTLPLDPFLVTIYDASHKAHPMKMSVAVEFDSKTHGELKDFTPRLRDGVIGYLRTVSYEQVSDPATVDKIRADILEKAKSSGASTAQRILLTDFVVQ